MDVFLVLNAGSSSLKFALFPLGSGSEQALSQGKIRDVGEAPEFSLDKVKRESVTENVWRKLSKHSGYDDIINILLDWISHHPAPYNIRAVGHRIVHGGPNFKKPVILTPDIIHALEKLVPLAPLHQPQALAVIREVTRRLPRIPQIACFDTSFHDTQPRFAKLFALPHEYADEGILRYGFHGLSYDSISTQLPKHIGENASGRIIIAHLGNGASLCALKNQKSIATTMGFTPLDGLMMGTRCGSLDPGIILHLIQNKQMSAKDLENMLYNESGLLGVSGISQDMKRLEDSNDPRAREAISLFVYRTVLEIGALIAALGGLDALIFTGGIGENSASTRQLICERMRWLGIELDQSANLAEKNNISSKTSKIDICIVPTNEEIVIVKNMNILLGGGETFEI